MQGRVATTCSFGSVAGAVSDQDLVRCVVCGLRFCHFRFHFFFFHSFLPLLRETWALTHPPKSTPLLSLTPLLLLCPRQTPCAQHPPLLRCSTRPSARTLTEAHTGRRSSLLECRAARAEGSSLGHGIQRRTGGRAGGQRRADCPCATARPPASH